MNTTGNHRRIVGPLPPMRHRALLIILLSCLSLPAHAQNWQAGGHLVAAFPQGAFKDRVGRAGAGISGLLGYLPDQQPFLLGIRIGLLNYGSQTWTTTGNRGSLEINSANNIMLLHAVGRLQSDDGMFRPYLEGLLGLNWLLTTSSFQTPSESYGEVETQTEIEFDDTAFSYGGGGGLMFLLSRSPKGETEGAEEGYTELLIDVGVQYLAGTRSQYLRQGSIQTSAGTTTYTPLESDTDLLIVQIGVLYRF
jgi:hypothetical protein